MKGLALSCVLFCGLALVLVYAATNGVGLRTPDFVPTLHSSTVDRRSQSIEAQPVVDIERGNPVLSEPSTLPKPEVTVTRSSRKRRHLAPKVAVQAPAPAETPQPKPAPTHDQPVGEKPKPKIEDKPAPIQKAPEPAKEEPVVHPRDVSDSGPLTDSDLEWRRQTLQRWRTEEQDRREGAINRSTITTVKPGQEPELKDTPAEGLFPAGDHKKADKKKKKRHRFLFIRW